MTREVIVTANKLQSSRDVKVTMLTDGNYFADISDKTKLKINSYDELLKDMRVLCEMVEYWRTLHYLQRTYSEVQPIIKKYYTGVKL